MHHVGVCRLRLHELQRVKRRAVLNEEIDRRRKKKGIIVQFMRREGGVGQRKW